MRSQAHEIILHNLIYIKCPRKDKSGRDKMGGFVSQAGAVNGD